MSSSVSAPSVDRHAPTVSVRPEGSHHGGDDAVREALRQADRRREALPRLSADQLYGWCAPLVARSGTLGRRSGRLADEVIAALEVLAVTLTGYSNSVTLLADALSRTAGAIEERIALDLVDRLLAHPAFALESMRVMRTHRTPIVRALLLSRYADRIEATGGTVPRAVADGVFDHCRAVLEAPLRASATRDSAAAAPEARWTGWERIEAMLCLRSFHARMDEALPGVLRQFFEAPAGDRSAAAEFLSDPSVWRRLDPVVAHRLVERLVPVCLPAFARGPLAHGALPREWDDHARAQFADDMTAIEAMYAHPLFVAETERAAIASVVVPCDALAYLPAESAARVLAQTIAVRPHATETELVRILTALLRRTTACWTAEQCIVWAQAPDAAVRVLVVQLLARYAGHAPEDETRATRGSCGAGNASRPVR
jgi:hypothetical protein